MKGDSLRVIMGLLLLIWAVFVADLFLPLEQFGLRPRELGGLTGIVAMPFLHGGLGHLMGNTVPLLVLLSLLALREDPTLSRVVSIAVLGGIILWLFGRSAIHIGASGLVFGLATYLIVAGWRERTFSAVAVAAVVALFYGGTLVSGVLPLWRGVSWDGHLAGVIAGAIVATTMYPGPSTRADRTAR